jgi:hypothetical protein
VSGPVEPLLSEVVLERDGRVLAAYTIGRNVRGDWVLLDQDRPQPWQAGGGAQAGGRDRQPGAR